MPKHWCDTKVQAFNLHYNNFNVKTLMWHKRIGTQTVIELNVKTLMWHQRTGIYLAIYEFYCENIKTNNYKYLNTKLFAIATIVLSWVNVF